MTSISVSVLKRIVRSLPAPPLHGIHHWIMGTARRCRNKRLSEEHTTVIIAAFEDKCRRPYKPQEVENAVGKAFSTSLNSKADTVKSFSWRSDITAGLVARDYKSEDDWRARSVANPEMLDPRDIIQLTRFRRWMRWMWMRRWWWMRRWQLIGINLPSFMNLARQ
jgi:hypothetical protein